MNLCMRQFANWLTPLTSGGNNSGFPVGFKLDFVSLRNWYECGSGPERAAVENPGAYDADLEEADSVWFCRGIVRVCSCDRDVSIADAQMRNRRARPRGKKMGEMGHCSKCTRDWEKTSACHLTFDRTTHQSRRGDASLTYRTRGSREKEMEHGGKSTETTRTQLS